MKIILIFKKLQLKLQLNMLNLQATKPTWRASGVYWNKTTDVPNRRLDKVLKPFKLNVGPFPAPMSHSIQDFSDKTRRTAVFTDPLPTR